MTGGLGSIGLEIAGYLAGRGAKHLVLTSRREPGEAARQRIDALAAQGCEVRAVTADVADGHDVARLLAGIQAELPPLAGIVHAAGEIGTTPLSDLDDAEVDRVFAGKVWGAWHLSEAAAGLKLDFFINTSSIAAVWGGYGQTAYSAANAFLDRLAWRLREQGIAGTSVNFGPWSAGMADAESVRDWSSAASRPCRPPTHWPAWPMWWRLPVRTPYRASSLASTGPASCRSINRRASEDSWRSWIVRCRHTWRGRRVHSRAARSSSRGLRTLLCSSAEAAHRLPARRGGRGDAR